MILVQFLNFQVASAMWGNSVWNTEKVMVISKEENYSDDWPIPLEQILLVLISN